MSVRLLAVDLDGTLVRGDRTVSDRTRAALTGCDDAGIRVVVVTARRWLAAAPVLRNLGLQGMAIVAGGGAVRDIASGRVTMSGVLRGDALAGAVDAILASGLQPMVAVDHGEHYLAGHPRHDSSATARQFARGRVTRTTVDAMRRAVAARVLAMGPASRIAAAARRCVGLPCHLIIQDCIHRVGGGGERVLELHAAAENKGTSLRRLCRQLRVPMGAVAAVGDAPSDLPMLEAVGTAVLMGQAEAGLRRRGMAIAPAVDADGAAWAIERLVLCAAAPQAA
ncbi:MAG: HAD family phosphatase [Chloroflexi bacterium]|nr:MAG: HAD family phosphatase [Chloroflexota bacterium]